MLSLLLPLLLLVRLFASPGCVINIAIVDIAWLLLNSDHVIVIFIAVSVAVAALVAPVAVALPFSIQY